MAAAMAWVLYSVWRSRVGMISPTYGAFAVAVIIVFLGLLAWARRKSFGSMEDDKELDRIVEA